MEPAITGLTSAEADERARRGLANRTRRSVLREYGAIVVRNVGTWFNAIVVPAAVALFVLGLAAVGEERMRQLQAGIAVSAMAAINTLLSLVQEIRAKIHLDRLAILVETRVRVLRDGMPVEIPAAMVVQDDCVLVRSGDAIVADGPVLQAQSLEIDEALLTGEADPVLRKPGQALLSGSFCVAGAGIYRAEQVGAASFAQKTSAEARRLHRASSPATRAIDRFVRGLTYVAVVLCLLYFVAYALQRDGLERNAFVRMIAATITSMVPQGMVLTATIAFSAGAIHMSRRGAMVQRLHAVETMAGIDVVCSDKTGTLTTNRLALEEIIPLDPTRGETSIRGDLALFASATLDRDNRNMAAIRAALGDVPAKAIGHLPFQSRNRYSAVRIETPEGPRLLIVGAVEALAPRMPDAAERIAALAAPRQQQGLRLLVFAEGPDDVLLVEGQPLPQCPLRPLALVGLGDELRPDAAATLRALDAQGIRFKIVSGDNPETVRGAVEALDMPWTRHPVVAGDELAASADRAALIRERSIFGRIAPHQKVEIVETLQRLGNRVAMIGDGVNDVLSIKKADLGIAMGAGSQAAKTVSDLVLESNRFDLLPETLDEGRTILRNLRRSGKLFLTKNVYSLVLILAWFLGTPFPYEPQQVTLLNWSVIGIPALAIALSRERSRMPQKSDFFRDLLGFALRHGLAIGLAGTATLVAGAWLAPNDVGIARTMLLSALVLLGIGVLFRAMDDGETAAGGPARLLGLAAIPVLLTAIYVAPIAAFFQLRPIGGPEWLVVLAVKGATWAGSELALRQTASRTA